MANDGIRPFADGSLAAFALHADARLEEGIDYLSPGAEHNSSAKQSVAEYHERQRHRRACHPTGVEAATGTSVIMAAKIKETRIRSQRFVPG